MAETPPNTSPAMEAAWRAYREELEAARRSLFGHPFAEDPKAQNRAWHLFHQLQAEAFLVALAPRPDYPRVSMMFEPLTFSWGIPTPDFVYRRMYLDGRRSYRLTVRRSNSLAIAIQALNAHFTLPPERLRLLGDYDLDRDFTAGPDGVFEIVVSATKREGNWIPLEAESDRNYVLFREILADWDAERLSEMHIETLDGLAPRPVEYGEAEMIERLAGAGRFVRAVAGGVSIKTVQDALDLAGGFNRFAAPKIAGAAVAAAAATYNIMPFELGPDAALIIELDPPNPRFWDIQAGDLWNQGVDSAYHQATLNLGQAAADADGKVRIVLAHRDPGLRNWLDPVGVARGIVMVRWYYAQGAATPAARLVRFADLDGELPPATARITAEARKAELAKRQRAIARRWNF
jgi:hypothetical protein